MESHQVEKIGEVSHVQQVKKIVEVPQLQMHVVVRHVIMEEIAMKSYPPQASRAHAAGALSFCSRLQHAGGGVLPVH